jgi:ribonuclease G
LVKIIINYVTTEKRYVVMKDKKITKLYIDQPMQRSLVGNIYLGIVTKVLPGMNAVFVDLGEEKQGFLHRDKLASYLQSAEKQKPISAYVHQGERILVQVEKDATGSKGPRLSGLVEFQGEYLIYQPQGGFVATSQKIESTSKRDELKQLGETLAQANEGFIFRTNSVKASTDQLISELHNLREQFASLQKEAMLANGAQLLSVKDLFLDQLSDELNSYAQGEIWVDDVSLKQRLENILAVKQLEKDYTVLLHQGKENVFDALGVHKEVERAIKRVVWLESGAFLVVDETEALTVIDVNSGKFVGRSSRELTVQQVNAEAAVEAARQLVLRDIGGIILIDFIDMKLESERQAVIDVLIREFKNDSKKPRLIGFTELGILQLTRRKTKPSLNETLLMDCPTCSGTGRVYSPESVAYQLERELWEYRHSDYDIVSVRTTEEVIQLFSGPQAIHLERLEAMIGMKVEFSLVTASKPFYEITKFASL